MNTEKILQFLQKHEKRIFQVLSYVLVAVLTASITVMLTLGSVPSQGGKSKLDALNQLIKDKFIGEADEKKIGDAAANAMIETLGDRWSYYIPADEFADYQDQKKNSYVGIGVTITPASDGSLEVKQVTAGGSAEEAGVQAGDFIIGVNGQSIMGTDLNTISAMIKGEAGTTVELTLSSGGQEKIVTVTRRQIRIPVATGKLLDGGIGLVRIENFNTNCKTETIAAIESLIEQGATKLIFDVRFNPGGYAKELVDILDYLLPKGDLLRTEDVSGKVEVETSDEKCLQMPMAVLVNGDSYSAAEFFAAALSEREWATVVGEQTSGKGYYQVTYSLPDGSAVGLSIGKYFTANGVSLEGVGITPDVVVPVDENTASAIYAGTIEAAADPQLQAAIKALADTE